MTRRANQVNLWLACVWVPLAACSGGGGDLGPGPDDAGSDAAADAAEPDEPDASFDTSKWPPEFAVCADRPALTSLRVLSDPPVVFRVAGPCEQPPARALLVNDGQDTVRVDKLGFPQFVLEPDSPAGLGVLSVSETDVPIDLGPGESRTLELTFASDVEGLNGHGALVAVTSRGCQTFRVFGLNVAGDTEVILNPLAVDMGVLRPGEVGEPVDIEFTFIRVGEALPEPLSFQAGGTFPAEAFEVLDPIESTTPNDCESLAARVRMVAPASPGVVEGAMFWESVRGGFAGVGQVILRGRVVEP